MQLDGWMGGWMKSSKEIKVYVGLIPYTGIWCYLQVDGVGIELSCRTPSWCRRTGGSMGTLHPPQLELSAKSE